MRNQDAIAGTVEAHMSPYGYPLATFEPSRLIVNNRMVELTAILWDAEYGAYRGDGFYVRQNGETGAQIAKPLMFSPEVPAVVVAAIAPYRTTGK